MTTGQRIKELRKNLGLTQEELGDMIGVKKAAINKYETGLVVNLKQTTIKALASALGVSPVYLLGAADDPPELASDELQLLTVYRSLSPSGKQYIYQQLTIASHMFGEKSESDQSEIG